MEKTSVGKRPVRLLGISLSNLTEMGSGRQLSLFKHYEPNDKRKDLNKTLDSIFEKFGDKGIRPGALIDK
jgi:DNA polymerase-4